MRVKELLGIGLVCAGIPLAFLLLAALVVPWAYKFFEIYVLWVKAF